MKPHYGRVLLHASSATQLEYARRAYKGTLLRDFVQKNKAKTITKTKVLVCKLGEGNLGWKESAGCVKQGHLVMEIT